MGLDIYGLIQVLFIGAFTLSSVGISIMLYKKIRPTENKNINDNKIACISSLSIGHRKKIMMLEVENKNFLIGVTDYKIETLHTFNKSSQSQDSEKNFSHTLMNKKLDLGNQFEAILKSKTKSSA